MPVQALQNGDAQHQLTHCNHNAVGNLNHSLLQCSFNDGAGQYLLDKLPSLVVRRRDLAISTTWSYVEFDVWLMYVHCNKIFWCLIPIRLYLVKSPNMSRSTDSINIRNGKIPNFFLMAITITISTKSYIVVIFPEIQIYSDQFPNTFGQPSGG